MTKFKIIVITSLLLLTVVTFLHAQDTDLEREKPTQKAEEKDQQGNYERAVIAAQKAIELAEANVGPDHPYVAISLNNLAELYSNQGNYDKAEPLYKRSLAIWGKALGPDHPYVANCLNKLSELYRATGKDKEALEVDKKVERIRAIKR